MYKVSLFKSTGHICKGSLTYTNPMPNIFGFFKNLLFALTIHVSIMCIFFTHSRYLSPIKDVRAQNFPHTGFVKTLTAGRE